MSKFRWYAGRLAAMSPSEVTWRIGRAGTDLLCTDRLRERTDSVVLGSPAQDWDELLQAFRDGIGRPALLDEKLADTILAECSAEVAGLLAAAEGLLAGERAYFGYPSTNIGTDVDWNYDPIAEYRWPSAPGRRIDHRIAPSDPKWIWELNRLQHLPLLAQAWLFTGDERFAEAAFEHLDSWLDQNPVGIGIAWRGAFEAGIRAISVAVALQGLGNSAALTTQRYRRVVKMLDASARYCWSARSRFSSANNHLIGELAGLLTVALVFPELAMPSSVRAEAMDLLVAETDRQILADGAGAEQSIAYQMFTAELMSLVVTLLRSNGDDVPSRLTQAINRSAGYVAGLVGTRDPDPRYGDDDDGFALRLGSELKRTARQHLGIVAASTGNTTAAGYGVTTLTAAWIGAGLNGRLGDVGTRVGSGEAAESFYAPDGGLVVLRNGRQRLTMDVGPLGYLSIAAHGHADALAVTLSAEGRDLIVDPGAGSYYGNPQWRTVHRGTRTHSTACVDGVDQSVIGGPFYWRSHATVTVHSVDLDRGIVDAEHDGYCRLDDPVVHRRLLIAPPGAATVAVVDLLDGRSAHDVSVSWPLHPHLDATPTRDGHVVSLDGSTVLQMCYAATAPIEVEQVRGDCDTDLGWWSDRLEARTPAWLVGSRCRARLPVAHLSVLCTVDATVIGEPEIVQDGRMLLVSWTENGIRRGYDLDRNIVGAVSNTASSAMSQVGES